MDINERISYIIELKGLNKNSFSLKIGIKPQTLHHIISKRKTKPSFFVIEKILQTFKDINAEWLITGQGEPIINRIDNENFSLKQTDELNILCPANMCHDSKIIEMIKKIQDLKQQITELQKDKEDLRINNLHFI